MTVDVLAPPGRAIGEGSLRVVRASTGADGLALVAAYEDYRRA